MLDARSHRWRGYARTTKILSAFAGLAAAMGVAGERDALACGGCLTPPPPQGEVESVITDEKMIFSISKDQTTLYDEIEYSGAPSSFAWVLPIKGTVTVGLSADILFSTMEQLTATQVIEPPTDCPPPPSCGYDLEAPGASGTGAAAADGGTKSQVTVTSQKQVGPYETVQLQSNDGSALTNWLHSHGYNVPASDAPVIAAYVAQHFNFLALKLVPGKGVQAMQPVRVTSRGASISLPLHMVAVGTGATTGITIWVVADGRWEPQNFPTFMITDAELTWDWTTGSSNYETLRLSKEAAFGGRGWQIESSLEQAQYTFTQYVLNSIQTGTSGPGGYTPVSDGGSGEAGDVDGGSGGVDAGDIPGETEAATQDMAILFAGISGQNARITRMRSDVAHSALSDDMFLKASSDQSELTNLHYPKGQIGQPLCPVYDDSCNQTGLVPRDQAVADANGGCNTTRSKRDSRATAALLLAFVGFGAIRFGRRRRKSS
jgi:hypothetical protein